MEKTGGHKRPLKVVVEPRRALARRFNDLCESDSVRALGNLIDWIGRIAALLAVFETALNLLL